MNKQKLFPLLAVLLLVTGMASAQLGQQGVKADIPFAFMVGSSSFSAGEYRVVSASDLGGVLAIMGENSKSALVGSHAVQENKAAADTKLIFHRYGDRYFLYRIWVAGEGQGRELPQTKLEKELASNRSFSSVAILARR
jgi:hypothetical protein